jgi:hypothetical protein
VPSATQTRPYPITRRNLLWLVVILAVAAALRLGRPDVLHFQYDQATQSILAQDMASGKALPLLGPESSSGIPHSPMSVYFLVPAFVVTHSVYWVTLGIMVWNILGVGLLWLIVHRYVHPTVAVLAGLLYAVSPYAVMWSRKIWVPSAHTPYILLGLMLLLLGYFEGRRAAQVAAIPVFLIGVQSHHASWFLVPLALWIVWLGRRHIAWRATLAGLALGIVVLLPYAAGLIQHYSGRAGGILDDMGGAPLVLRAKVFDRYLPLVTGSDVPDLAGDAAAEMQAAVPVPNGLWLLMFGFAGLGLAATLLKREARPLGVALLLWIVLPPLAFWVNWSGVYWHFFVPMVPGLMLAAALGAYALTRLVPDRRALAGQIVIFGLLGAIGLTQVIWTFHALDWVNTHYTPNGFSTPLRYSLDVAAAVADYDDVLILGGESSTSGYQVWHALLYDSASSVREVVVDGAGIAVFPAGPFAVITAPRAAPFPLAGLYTSDAPQVFPLRSEAEGAYTVDTFAQAPTWPGPALEDIPPRSFANGVRVTGYALANGQLYTAWELPASPGEGAPLYRFFAHVLDANGERIIQQDFNFWSALYWREGDRLVLWGALDVAAEAATLRLGMYAVDTAGEIHGLDVYDDSGAAAPWVDVPLAS